MKLAAVAQVEATQEAIQEDTLATLEDIHELTEEDCTEEGFHRRTGDGA